MWNHPIHFLKYSCVSRQSGTSDKVVKEAFTLTSKVQKRLLCFLNTFSEGSLGVAGSRSNLRLAQQFMSIIWVINPYTTLSSGLKMANYI